MPFLVLTIYMTAQGHEKAGCIWIWVAVTFCNLISFIADTLSLLEPKQMCCWLPAVAV